MAKRGAGPAPFLVKTHQMVEAAATDDVISWGENGKSFVVRKPVEFARDLLPVHFKHDNFSSFVRQLNTYGFRKVVPNKWEFANEHFRKGEPNLLCNIRRRKLAPHATGKSNSHQPPPPPTTTTSSTTSSPLSSPCHDLVALTNENEQLKKDNETLSSELAAAKKRCNELLGFLSKFVDMQELDFWILMEGDESSSSREVKVEAKEEECCEFKLFGVRLKGGMCGRKRGLGLSEDSDTCGVTERPMKIGFGPQLIGSVPVVPMQQTSGKVCH